MADVKQLAELVVRVKDEATAAVNKINKSVSGFDKNLAQSSQSSKKAGKDAATASAGVDKLGTSADKSAKSLGNASKSADKADKSISSVGKSSKKASSDIGSVGKKSDKSAKSLESFGSAISKLVGNLASLAALSAIVIAPIVETAQFNRSMAEVKAIVGDISDNEFQKMTATAREMGSVTEFSAKQASEGLKFLAMSGMSAAESIEALPGVLNLAQAGNVGLGQAADIATNILTGMGLEVSELARVNDVLVETFTSTNSSLVEIGYAMSYVAPIAAGLGVTIEDTSAALGMLHNAGIKGSMAGTTLRGMLVKLAGPGTKAARVMAEVAARIGQTSIDILDSKGKFIGFSKVLKQFEKAGLTVVEATKILGVRAGPGLSALVLQGSAAFDELNAKLLDSAGRADQVAKVMHDNLVGDFKSATSAVSELAISIGDKLIPVARMLMQLFSGMVGTISDLIKDYPALSTAVLVLAGAFASLAAAISAVSIVKTLAPLIAVQWGAMTAGVVAFTSATSAGFLKAAASVKAFALANPILAAITAALVVAGAAYAIFGESAADSAKKHQENAEKIGEARKKLSDEVRELEAIKKILSEDIPGSENFVKAQERMAELIPGTNVYLDEQGRILAKIGGDGKEAAKGLGEYIDKLKEQEKLDFAMELEQQQKALGETSKALKEHSKDLEENYGIGDESASLYQRYAKWISESVGAYDKNIRKGAELRESHKKTEKELSNLLNTALRSGMSVDELSSSLSRGQVGAKESAAIIGKYTEMVKATEEEHRKAAAAAIAGGNSTIKSYEDQTLTVEQLKEELKTLKSEQKLVSTELKDQNSIVKGSLDALKKGYDELSKSAKQRADSEIEAIDDITKARLKAVSGQAEGQRIAAEVEIIRKGNQAKLKAVAEYSRKAEQLLREEAVTRREFAGQGAENVAAVENEILEKRRAVYAESVSSYRAMIDSMISEENRHKDAISKIEDEKANLKLSTADKIRNLERLGMSESEQNADKQRQLDEKQSAARRALAEGDFEKAKQLNEQARSMAEQGVLTEAEPGADGTGGVTAAEASQSVQKTISELKESEAIGNSILDKMAAAHNAAAAALAADRSRIERSIVSAEQKLVDLDAKLQRLTVADIQVDTGQLDSALDSVNELSTALEELDGKVVETEVIVNQRTVEERATGGIVGSMVGKFQKMKGIISGGSGGIDDVPVMGTAGEGITTLQGMSRIGHDVFNNLKDGIMTVPDVRKLITRGVIPQEALQPQAATLAGNVSTSTFNVTIDGQTIRPTAQVQSATQRLIEAVKGGYGS